MRGSAMARDLRPEDTTAAFGAATQREEASLEKEERSGVGPERT
jgi:hypothetical protein